MSKTEDAIQSLAYAELLIACQIDGCGNVFQPTLTEPATDPVERWAERMANRARQVGWSVNGAGRVLCPIHSEDCEPVRTK
jgi:hypothetical protein